MADRNFNAVVAPIVPETNDVGDLIKRWSRAIDQRALFTKKYHDATKLLIKKVEEAGGTLIHGRMKYVVDGGELFIEE